MSSNPRWWPYRLPIEEALKKSLVLVLGVVVGANVIEYLWNPMQDYEADLDKGKLALLQKYKKIHDEREIANDAYGSDSDLPNDNNAFRPIFKKYKKRVPPPDFSQVIDSRDPNNFKQYGLESRMVFDSICENDITIAEKLGLRHPSEWRVCTFPDRPGLYLLPQLLLKTAAPIWIERVFRYAEPPNVTNMTAHGTIYRNVLENAGKSLRWTTLGVEYDWATKEYPAEGRPIPEELRLFGQIISRSLNLGEMQPDATIVNYYPPKAYLSPHVDRSERSDAPLISLSLGQTAVYLSGGNSLTEPPIPLWLRNGDLLVLHGAQRLVYHAIPCIGVKSQATVFDDVADGLVRDYLNTSRVNITIRQVNPH
ncbi:unnamed protein product [Caenorhabditis bovis]|uniref:Fe2OG dioxygenase domain-containing protein n=1 Tax=Caenorhabditis bovis TaxID=2654633 RepID=A0A8S1F106_9PELO|nr:unnamed protein product [Caenorhabditis bovis]